MVAGEVAIEVIFACCVIAEPPLVANVTVYVHFAYSVIFAVTVYGKFTWFAKVPLSVNQPPKVLLSRVVTGDAATDVTFTCCATAEPPLVANVTVYVGGGGDAIGVQRAVRVTSFVTV